MARVLPWGCRCHHGSRQIGSRTIGPRTVGPRTTGPRGRPLSVPFLFRASGKGTDTATMLRLEKYGKWTTTGQNALKWIQHMPGFQEHSTDSIFIHFSGCDSLFSKCYIPIYSQFTPRGPKYIQEMLLRLAIVTK